MSKTLSRTLYLLSLLALMIGGCLLVRGLVSGTVLVHSSRNHADSSAAATPGVIALLAGGGALACIAWIGALIRTAQLGHWSWFICLLLFSGLAMLLYIFIGPQYPTYPVIPVTTPYAGRGG
jgi:hypothetical protein